mmetsp:Transcript_76911/g.193450  ORF Transcript_76911/g.193450 Transcript_76911/m.193450 type:complete len:218 (+) Transcript_76911:569-1222(+)
MGELGRVRGGVLVRAVLPAEGQHPGRHCRRHDEGGRGRQGPDFRRAAHSGRRLVVLREQLPVHVLEAAQLEPLQRVARLRGGGHGDLAGDRRAHDGDLAQGHEEADERRHAEPGGVAVQGAEARVPRLGAHPAVHHGLHLLLLLPRVHHNEDFLPHLDRFQDGAGHGPRDLSQCRGLPLLRCLLGPPPGHRDLQHEHAGKLHVRLRLPHRRAVHHPR